MADDIEIGLDTTQPSNGESVELEEFGENALSADEPDDTPINDFPPAILSLPSEKIDEIKTWLRTQIDNLINEQNPKITEWAEQETKYRARSEGPKTVPFVGACGDVVPLIAMAVDPIFARLDVGLFKGDRMLKLKALKKSMVPLVEPLELWLDFYFRHYVDFRSTMLPRLLEFTKHGTMVFKTVFENDTTEIQTYDADWSVVTKILTRFRGPRPIGIPLENILFSPRYQNVQDCPIIAERQKFTIGRLYEAQFAGKLTNVEKLDGRGVATTSDLESTREKAANHTRSIVNQDEITVYECWFDYPINPGKKNERLVATYSLETNELLQLRFNWYFHQRKPYTIIPYQIVSDSLYGLGLCEMISPFQDSMTDWDRMAKNNAYLANIRMFIARKDSGIEDQPKLFSGRVFRVDDPSKDLIPFALADIYNSTLSERQNTMGMTEKRTGVSDYLTGRESPIVGSRATATSTMALIKEGTQRVEEVLENIRTGLIEIATNCIYIWMQYGLQGLDDAVFGDDEIINQIKDFFNSLNETNVNGAIALDIAAIDAANNQSVQQQVQLALIQVMMGYLEKLLSAGQAALGAQQSMPQYTEMVGEVMTAARKMFKDLLTSGYHIRNPDDYLPDLEKFLSGTNDHGAFPGVPGGSTDMSSGSTVPYRMGMVPGNTPAIPTPGIPGYGSGAR